jgi:hypothetical protein
MKRGDRLGVGSFGCPAGVSNANSAMALQPPKFWQGLGSRSNRVMLKAV